MKVYYDESCESRAEHTDQRYLPPVPQAVLDRHGARVLDPSSAAPDPGRAPPRPTVYRSARLLLTGDALRRLDELNAVLGQLGLKIIRPRGDAPAELARPAALVIRTDWRGPAVLDAWVALRHLQTARPPRHRWRRCWRC